MTALVIWHRPTTRQKKSPASSSPSQDYPLVSLLKPVKGMDDGLEANLESFYQLDYPLYEILFAVDDWQDESCALIKKLAARYPVIHTKILATGDPLTENPKIHKLSWLESESRGRLLWVTDASVRVEPQTLRRLVEKYSSSKAKLIFSPVLGTNSRSLASLMENTYLNFFTSGNIIALWKLFRQPVVMGKSILLDRAALKTFGGFKYFKDYLAEDYLIGKSFQDSGFKVDTNYIWIKNISEQASLKTFLKRTARWAMMRSKLNRPAYLAELLLNPVVIALAAMAAFGAPFLKLALAVAAGKIILEYLNFLVVNQPDRRRAVNHLFFPAMVMIRDLLLFAVYLTPFFSSTINWRGHHFKIGKNSLITPQTDIEKLIYEEA
jgi:ceramide glucosyltransferase